jgi:hypothetical protein
MQGREKFHAYVGCRLTLVEEHIGVRAIDRDWMSDARTKYGRGKRARAEGSRQID